MKALKVKLSAKLFFPVLFVFLTVNCFSNSNESFDYYYGIEMNKVLCGYQEFDTSYVIKNGQKLLELKHNLIVKFKALGSKVNTEVKLIYLIDPETGNFTYHRSHVKQGPTELTSEIFIRNDTARFTSSLGNESLVIPLPKDVLLENTLIYNHLKKDFVDEGTVKKTYNIFEVREAKIQESVYSKTGEDVLDLGGRKYRTIILERFTPATGVRALLWIDTETGMYVKSSIQGNRESYLADHSVVKNIEMANVDENILQKTNVSIADIKSISSMKIRAKIEPFGLMVTEQKLNVPGQKFTGSVNENLIEGIFEINYPKYSGDNAPSFPAEYSLDEKMKKYLEPYAMIESDDPVLIEKAKEITEDAKNSWEAACKLSAWVAEKIDYAIPGGGTARKTYDMRAGECGAHSTLLAAFCRAVNIPARVVWGCMYIPKNGGSFGQHAWNEIFMGSERWIPVDATANEIDFVDAGHVRLGEFESISILLNAKEIEVLDYELSSNTDKELSEFQLKDFEKLIGQYRNSINKRVVNVIKMDNKLALDIPNKMKLPLLEPDDQGRWFCSLTNKLYVTFNKPDDTQNDILTIHEMNNLIRQPDTLEIENPVPEKFMSYLGKYMLYAAQAEFKVIFHDDRLAIDDPLAKKIIHLQDPNSEGQWLDEFNKNKISFSEENGTIVSMTIESISEFDKL